MLERRRGCVILARFERALRLTAAKANSACLLDRVHRMGQRMAAKRGAWAKMEEERMMEENRSYWQAYVKGLGRRRGNFPAL